MKRFSAPPALYPPPPSSNHHHPLPTTSKASDPSPNSSSCQSQGQGSSHTGPQRSHPHPHPQDPSSKRVKTEQTFESLFDKESHSDVTINVNMDEGVFHAHRMVLEVKSDVLGAMLAKLMNHHQPGDLRPTTVGGSRGPVLHVQEDPECSRVFSRFLYFMYSGAVWLHQEYVLPLFRLASKYGVQSLRQHCHTYILQVLAKSCHSSSSHCHHHNNNNNNNNNTAHNHSTSNTAVTVPPNANCPPPYAGSGFPLHVVCDLYEEQDYEGDIRQTAFRLLCCQFRQLVRTERWLRFAAPSVCSFIASDSCSVEENLILVSATDYMKRNNLADKKRIEEILSLIRYPRLNRRVLYHLHKNGSFKNFPHIQELMLNAMKYHCFKDLPEAKDDFVGSQFRPRMSQGGSPNRRASTHVASLTDNQSEATVFAESAYSLDPSSPMALAPSSRHSQV
ncbi:hypothetical protein ACOMHN_065756 [Nucella lapillus]